MSMELKLPDFLENYDRQTNQQTDMRGHRGVTVPIKYSYSEYYYSLLLEVNEMSFGKPVVS